MRTPIAAGFIAALIAVGGPCAAQPAPPEAMGWDLVGSTPNETQFTKPAPAAPPYIRRLVRSEGSAMRTYGSFSFISMVNLVEYDCAARKSRSINATLYSRNNIAGDILNLTAPGSWRAVPESGLAFEAMTRACAESK